MFHATFQECNSKKQENDKDAQRLHDLFGVVRHGVLPARDREGSVHPDRRLGEEIRRQRFARVKLLLETTDRTISEIAATTGYCTSSHLTNAFKKAFALTPKAWRSRQKSSPPVS